MSVLKAVWINSPGVEPDKVVVLEERYAKWMTNLCDGNFDHLKQAHDKSSGNHWEYIVWNEKALLGIKPHMPDHITQKPQFALKVYEAAP